MTVIGLWVVEQIEEGVIDNAGATTALLIDSFVAPLAQELTTSESLSIGPTRALDEVFQQATFQQRIVSVKIWKLDGTIAYSNDIKLVGRKFDVTPGLSEAAAGNIRAEFNQLSSPESADLASLGIPLLEVYSPIRESWQGDVIAVIEFYADATDLASSMAAARQKSWLVVGGVTLGMALLLLGIVHSGSVLIARQRRSIEAALAENQTLLERTQRASGRAVELTEQQLRRVSADLHDGPAQLIGVAALRIGALPIAKLGDKAAEEGGQIVSGLQKAMQEIRDICKGLSLPDIERQKLAEIVDQVVDSHMARTRTKVALDVSDSGPDLPPHLKIGLYRFLQEGLNNAYRHGGGREQAVVVKNTDALLSATVSNLAGATDKTLPDQPHTGLGLMGLKERIETLGGKFEFAISGSRAILSMQVHHHQGGHA
ncbi:MAG: sensor histidine kinase [Hyphomicrobiaceae bacterium]|nr:sensor histidine kinase [Hyphomicrobiaceae bacterium]